MRGAHQERGEEIGGREGEPRRRQDELQAMVAGRVGHGALYPLPAGGAREGLVVRFRLHGLQERLDLPDRVRVEDAARRRHALRWPALGDRRVEDLIPSLAVSETKAPEIALGVRARGVGWVTVRAVNIEKRSALR